MSNRLRRTSSTVRWSLGLLLIASALGLLGLMAGSAGLDSMLFHPADALAHQLVLEIRLPRTLGAWLAGALLGLAGAISQGLFRNPLADPYLLGGASGASLGVALLLGGALVWPGVSPGWLALGLTGAGFLGAWAAVVLTVLLARGAQHTLRLLLSGMVVAVVLGATTSLILVMVPQIMQTLQSFMLGSTAFVGRSACALLLGVWALCLLASLGLSRVLDGLALGEATALSLGLPLAQLRLWLIAVLALASGAAVAHTGLIAFVGLAAPHLVRTQLKLTHGRLILLSSLMGGVLLLAADLLARLLLAPRELPVGALTALLGGSYLLWLMQQRLGAAARSGPT